MGLNTSIAVKQYIILRTKGGENFDAQNFETGKNYHQYSFNRTLGNERPFFLWKQIKPR
jgi:hypothetical protein